MQLCKLLITVVHTANVSSRLDYDPAAVFDIINRGLDAIWANALFHILQRLPGIVFHRLYLNLLIGQYLNGG